MNKGQPRTEAFLVAAAIVNYINSRDARPADKSAAMKRAFGEMVEAINEALGEQGRTA